MLVQRRFRLMLAARGLAVWLACAGACAWAGPTAGSLGTGYSFEAAATTEFEDLADQMVLASLPSDEVFQAVLAVRGTRFPAGAESDDGPAPAPAAVAPSRIAEPATLALVGLSLMAAAWAPRRRRVTLPSPAASPAADASS
jgi:hypothetical protein